MVRRCLDRRDITGAEAANKIVQRLELARDKWLVRHGPTPFLDFVRLVRPDILIGPHHRRVADAFRRIAAGELKWLMIFMPPGHSKTVLASILLPAWLYGLEPSGRVLSASHTVDLVEDFGREVRDLLASPAYQRLFPRTVVRRDVRAAGKWSTTRGGKYQALGVGTAAAGRRADLVGVIDDPISEQDAYSTTRKERVHEWYPGGFRTRMMPGTPVCLMNTRWSADDLAGELLGKAGGDRWEVISVPAILGDQDAVDLAKWAEPGDPPVSAGRAPFEALWSTRDMLDLKKDMPPSVWSALYMQQPIKEGGNILMRDWWKPWPSGVTLPEITYLLQVWDTAYDGPQSENDYNACTTWGVFEDPFTDKRKRRNSLILLGRVNERLSFPDLREKAYGYWRKWNDSDVGPVNQVLVEAKAAGRPLIQELQRRGVPIMPWHTERGSDGREKSKVARAHASSVVLWSGGVYYPENRRWPEEVIAQCESFPNGGHDDLVDTCVTAWLWLRRNWQVFVTHDQEEDAYDDEDVVQLVRREVEQVQTRH